METMSGWDSKSLAIHHSAIIGPKVTLGLNTVVGPGAIILGNTNIGDNCTIAPYAVIGTPAEKHGYFDNIYGTVEIGNNCIIREFVTINAGTTGTTKLGDNVIMLRASHAGHDSHVEDNCIVSCNAIIGGHAHIMTGVNLGLGAILHQHVVVGSYSMIGMGAVVSKKSRLVPGNIYAGNPAKFLKNNTIGLERRKVTQEMLLEEIQRYGRLSPK